MKTLTRDEQRRQHAHRVWTSAKLELLLRSLARKVLDGERESLASFQQWVQYAPPEMKARIDTYITVAKYDA